jgi:hypothetical protein
LVEIVGGARTPLPTGHLATGLQIAFPPGLNVTPSTHDSQRQRLPPLQFGLSTGHPAPGSHCEASGCSSASETMDASSLLRAVRRRAPPIPPLAIAPGLLTTFTQHLQAV